MDKRVTAYYIAESEDAQELEQHVLDKIDDGWELQGGVSVAMRGHGAWWYFQAMVRYADA